MLSRQIVEAHGGTIEVANRREHQGCEVKITLPRGEMQLKEMIRQGGCEK